MKEQELKRQLDEIAREAFPETLHPWTTFQACLQEKNSKPSKRGFTMKTQTKSTKLFLPAARIAAIIVLALLFVGAVILITPQGRALAENVFHFFTRTESNIISGPTEAPLKWVEQTPGVPAATLTPLPTQAGPVFEAKCGNYSNPKCTVEEVRALVTFPVFQFAEIPAGFYFVGATGGPDRIDITYMVKNQGGQLTISEEPWAGSLSQKSWQVGASADIQMVKVGEATAEYVKGSYNGNTAPAQWDSNADVQSLRWINQGVLFTAVKVGSNPSIDRDSLAALLGKLTTNPVAALTPIPTEKPTEDPVEVLKERYSFSIEQAASEGGFTIHQPTTLPEVLTLLGARYEPDQKWVLVFYLYDQKIGGPNTDGLVLTEQIATNSSACGLCKFIIGEGVDLKKYAPGQLVGKDASIETVTIGNSTGQYVEGMWNLTDNGPVWVSDPYLKRLRWEANGTAYELTYMGMGITKDDMTAIAKSIK